MSRCADYEPARVARAVEECFDRLPEASEVFKRGARVLVKPNLLSAERGPDYPVNTHPAVLRAVARTLQSDFGCEVWIGDSCGSLGRGSTARAIEVSGTRAVGRELGVRVFDVDREPSREVDVGGRVLRSVRLPELLSGVDAVVSVPKLKTHGLTRYTGAIKNLLGLIPGRGKKDAHVLAPGPMPFAELLADLAAVVGPRFAVLDGVVGMEGNGPNAGRPRRVGVIAASRDPVALDAVACDLIGYEPLGVPTLTASAARGLGEADPRRVTVEGVRLDEVRVADFARPPGDRFRFMAGLLPRGTCSRIVDAMGTSRPAVNVEECRLCGECVRNCPVGALREEGGRIRVRTDRCIACYCCEEVCPWDAVRLRGTHFARLLGGLTAIATGRRAP